MRRQSLDFGARENDPVIGLSQKWILTAGRAMGGNADRRGPPVLAGQGEYDVWVLARPQSLPGAGEVRG